ncbi:MAG: hypothetical protein M3302_02365 [Actinomycetota bacterium]|nr:hypothetical protein [Actinomycetota bacterium]
MWSRTYLCVAGVVSVPDGAAHPGQVAATVMAAIDQALRAFGGVPTYGRTDNEKAVTVEHVTGIAVRNHRRRERLQAH